MSPKPSNPNNRDIPADPESKCPCGSGVKTKYCHGGRIDRNGDIISEATYQNEQRLSRYYDYGR